MEFKKFWHRCLTTKKIITVFLFNGLGYFYLISAYSLPDKHIKYLPSGDSKGTQEGVVFTINSLIQGIANGLAVVAVAVAVLFVAINAGRIAFSFGDTEKVKKGRDGLMWSMGGLILIVFAYILTKSIIALIYAGG